MSYYDEASLVMIPSGYKTSKVYSIKPTDGSGDLAFTRSNDTATRVGPDGLIEKVRTNLITYSNDFTNAVYSKITDGTYTITSETITDPFGNSVAVKKVTLTSGGYLVLRNTLGSATTSPTTGSVYIKKTVSTTGVDTDLSDGGVAVSANNTNWQRLVSINPASVYGSGTFLDINITTLNEPVYIAYAQIELSDFGATDYIATTTAAVSVGPVANVPRLDYLNSSCPRLLLEPQRTNLVTYSEQFANWSNAGGTTTANTAVSPSGYQDADTLTGARFQSGFATSQQYTASCFAKKVDGDNKIALRLDVPTLKFAQFDLATGTIDSVSTDYSATITPYGNGWYRCTITTPASTSISNYVIVSATGGGLNTYVWGAQLEAGAYATSYIPTLGAAVTRGQDVTSKSGISSLIGQANGTAQMTFVMDSDTSADSTTMLGIHASTSTANRIQLLSRFGNVRLLVVANNSIVSNVLLYDAAPNEVVNVAFKYGSAGVTAYVNGTQVYTTASAVVFTETMELFTIGNRSGIDEYGKGQRVSQSLLFPSALSNSDLAALTA